MNIENLQEVLKDEPKFRLQQAIEAIFINLVNDWSEVTNFSLKLREELNEKCPLNIDGQFSVSENKSSAKALIKLEDDNKIETVLMQHRDDRNTVCISTQVGCALGCKFCATGEMGFKRDLTVSEILEQVLFVARFLKKQDQKITNIVYMGMGEPFLNYDNVMQSIRILNDSKGFNLGARRISISTSGIPEGILKLANEELQVNLAVSLHATNDELRQKLMPVAKKYLLKDVFKSVDEYIKKTNRQVMFEYMLIKDVNDSSENARELVKLMKNKLYMVNLIRYNPTESFEPSSPEQIKKFKTILEKHHITFTQRQEFGQDIKAACGQLAGNK